MAHYILHPAFADEKYAACVVIEKQKQPVSSTARPLSDII